MICRPDKGSPLKGIVSKDNCCLVKSANTDGFISSPELQTDWYNLLICFFVSPATVANKGSADVRAG
ncbi:MAG TPA: hypothetical protein PL119_06915, partial [Bacteroidales bacterium]|nr:hypothetical protein [Bacteroidales bacterium]